MAETANPELAKLKRALRALASPSKARVLQGFFKTGPGQYGEGDRFIGVTVPQIRALVKAHRGLGFRACASLLASPVHEERALGLFIVTDAAQRAAKRRDKDALKACHDFYMANLKGINNWDLVDLSAPQCVGAWLWENDRSALDRLAASPRMWDRRVAVLATFHFIKMGRFEETLRLSARLLDDPEDLMHKATGWMLREVGKRGGRDALLAFLERHGRRMPRTMLRYAIERFPEKERKGWLKRTSS